MYGLVNQAIEDLVTTTYGNEKWSQIMARADVEEEVFISNQAYPDAVTYSLVAAASQVLGVSQETVLGQFGEWWVLNTAQKSYGAMMSMGGSTLPEFLTNLPNFHVRVKMIFPDLNPPTFHCSDITACSMNFHYVSQRAGLAPFVRGIIQGLGKRFSIAVNVEQTQHKDQGDDHDVFAISW